MIKNDISVFADLIENLGKGEFFVINGNMFSETEILEIQKELIKRNGIKIDASNLTDAQIVATEDLGVILDGFNDFDPKVFKLNGRVLKQNGRLLYKFSNEK